MKFIALQWQSTQHDLNRFDPVIRCAPENVKIKKLVQRVISYQLSVIEAHTTLAYHRFAKEMVRLAPSRRYIL